MKQTKERGSRRLGQSTVKKRPRRDSARKKNATKRHTAGAPAPLSWQARLRAALPLLLLFVVVVLFFTLFHTRQVDGVSMQPTLSDGERLLVRRTTTFQRYEVITFEPKDRATESYVKRIIGMPGDALRLEGNRLYLYEGQMTPATAEEVTDSVAVDRLPDGTLMVTLEEAAAEALRPLKAIPEGQYFVLGDNRNNSRDSRELGLIEAPQIEGRVVLRYFPLTKFGRVS